jgi:hypothetical protein
MNKDIIVVDLIENDFFLDLFYHTLSVIEKSNDPLKENYVNINLNEFLSFPILIKNSEIICFSGAQIKHNLWGENIVRISTRFWKHPNYRINSLHKLTNIDTTLNIKYCIPIQLEKLKKHNIECFFISRESKKTGKVMSAFNEYTELINKEYNQNLKILPNRYKICGLNSENEKCKQYISLHHSENSLKIWDENMKKCEISSDF